jgi:hypothetical protein
MRFPLLTQPLDQRNLSQICSSEPSSSLILIGTAVYIFSFHTSLKLSLILTVTVPVRCKSALFNAPIIDKNRHFLFLVEWREIVVYNFDGSFLRTVFVVEVFQPELQKFLSQIWRKTNGKKWKKTLERSRW